MARASAKTVRFTQVVERSGEPRAHTLWLPPEKDPELKRAQKANRVMTVAPAGASGTTDAGIVGFEPTRDRAQFLIFPKSLKRFEGARVVGIKFDLVEQPDLAPASALKRVTRTRTRHAARKTATSTRPPPAPAEPVEPTRSIDEENAASSADVVPFESSRAEAESARPPRPPAQRSTARPRASANRGPKSTSADRALLREVRAAMNDLRRGKSVSAYQRLERAVAKAEA